MIWRLAKRAARLIIPPTVVGIIAFNFFGSDEASFDEPSRKPAAWLPPAFQILRSERNAVPLESFQETLSRPLFYKARRPVTLAKTDDAPPTKPAVPPPLQPAPTRAIALEGVVVTAALRRALLASPPGAGAIWVDEGAVFAGWTLKLVDGEKVTLVNGDENLDIKLYSDIR